MAVSYSSLVSTVLNGDSVGGRLVPRLPTLFNEPGDKAACIAVGYVPLFIVATTYRQGGCPSAVAIRGVQP